MFYKFLAHADTGIPDGELIAGKARRGPGPLGQAHGDLAAGGGVLDGVAH